MLPWGKDIFFKDSSFSQYGAQALPSPAEVRAQSKELGKSPAPPPVRFQSQKLLVKYGRQITIAEGQCLWAIKRVLGTEVPVPEVYGWRQDGNEVFIYMELVDGETLEQRWGSLSTKERSDICGQLRDIITALRRLEQDPADRFVGKFSWAHLPASLSP